MLFLSCLFEGKEILHKQTFTSEERIYNNTASLGLVVCKQKNASWIKMNVGICYPEGNT